MKATIDAAGRVVIPKALRTALGLEAGQELELRAVEGRIEMEVAPTPMSLAERNGQLVAVVDEELPPLATDEVRDALEAVRR